MEIHCSARTHVGRRRNNEDAHAVHPELGVVVVADGMGGYEGGEVASRIVVDTVVELFRRTAIDPEATWPHAPRPARGPLLDLVSVALRRAHGAVLERRHGALARMGSTAVVVAWQGARLVIGHVGDSRAYRWRHGRLTRLTRDHSVAEEVRLASAGDEAVDVGSFRHMLTRAVGMPGELGAEVAADVLAPGDVLLLCSDGVWEPLTNAEIGEALARPRPDDAAADLLARAYAAGGTDNLTAAVLRVVGGGGGQQAVLAQEGA